MSSTQPLLDAGVLTRCRHRVHLEHDPAAIQPDVPADPTAEQRLADRAAHADEVLAGFAERFGAGFVDAGGDVRATLAAIEAGAACIAEAALPARGHRRGTVSLLLRAHCGGSNAAGYHPVLIRHHRITDPGQGARTSSLTRPGFAASGADASRKARPHSADALHLAHAWRMLEAVGAAAPGPARGGVIGLDADVVLWHELESGSWPGGHTALAEYDKRFADRLAIATAAAAGGPGLTEPSRIVACRRCPWWERCRAQLRARHDVSLVVTGNDADTLRAAGIHTVDQLAGLDYDTVVTGTSGPLRDPIALARAWLADETVIRKVARVEVPRADVEVDVDMESFGDAGAYLWGCLLSGADIGIEPGYHPFVTWTPLPSTDEARSFAEFWSWLTEVRRRCAERGYSFAAYCYNERAENRWLLASADRFAGADGVPNRARVQSFIDSPQWVDLYACVAGQFLCARGKGLKVVAPVAGFSWQDPEAGGENSMRWYRAAVGYGGTEPDLTQRKRLLQYNEDDVRATYALRVWMSGPANELPHLDDLAARAS